MLKTMSLVLLLLLNVCRYKPGQSASCRVVSHPANTPPQSEIFAHNNMPCHVLFCHLELDDSRIEYTF